MRARGALGGDRRSERVEKHADVILAMLDAKPDITLAELQGGLADGSVTVSGLSIWRFFDWRRITLKKVGVRGRTRPSRYIEVAACFVREPAGSEAGPTGIPRRDGCHDQDGPPAWPGRAASTYGPVCPTVTRRPRPSSAVCACRA